MGVLLSLSALLCEMAWAQTNREEILEALSESENSRQRLLDGLSVSYTMLIERRGHAEALLEGTYHQLEPDVWRCDVRESSGLQRVVVRDGSFAFEAVNEPGSGGYRFGALGFSDEAHRDVYGAMFARNDLVSAATQAQMVDLQEFFAAPTVAVRSVSPGPPLRTGQRTEVVAWEAGRDEKVFAFDCRGTIEWLPDNGYLVTRLEFYAGKGETSGGPGLVTDVEYEERDGRLLPVRSLKREGFVSFVANLQKISPGPTERSFYKAEAIGLETPVNPLVWQVLWLVLGAICLFAGVIFVGRRLRKR